MLRVLLLLLTLLLGVLGSPGSVVVGPEAVLASAAEVDDCCPDAHDEAGDCCDLDHGACCGTGPAVAVSADAAAPVAHAAPVPTRDPSAWAPFLRERLRGPPPTPPPIA